MVFAIIITGLLVGIISTFFGLGGGSVIVPILYTIFPSMTPETIIPISLGVILINNSLNIIKFHKKNLHPHYKLIIPMAITMIIGVIFGIKITEILPSIQLKRIFSFVLIASSLFTLIRKIPDHQTTDTHSRLQKRKYLLGTTCSFFAGIIATTTGIGGGIIIIPVLIHFIRVPFKLVPVNTNIIVLAGALVGTILFALKAPQAEQALYFGFKSLQFGPLDLNLVLTIAFFAFFTSFLGLKLSQNTKPFWAKQIFAVMLLIVALNILRTTL